MSRPCLFERMQAAGPIQLSQEQRFMLVCWLETAANRLAQTGGPSDPVTADHLAYWAHCLETMDSPL